jgi:hypothetical protein
LIWLLVITYVLVVAGLLTMSLRARWPIAAKIVAVVLVSSCYGLTYVGLRALEGWPADTPLPEEFRLVWVTVEEPDKETGEDGIIFFWVKHLDEYGDPTGEPRAYRVAWSDALAEQAEQALEQVEDGETLNGFITRQVMAPEEDEVDVTSQKSTGQQSLGDEAMYVIEFRDVPKPTLPEKSTPTS